VLHGTRVSLRIWFLGAFFLGRHKQGISALQFQRDTGLGSYQTAWTLLHKLRSGLARNPADRLTGAVEADETYLGGPHRGRGRGLGKTGVAVVVERREKSAGKARLNVIGRATSEELCAVVRGAIDARRTEVFTDGWAAYQQLGSEGISHHPEVAGRGPAAAEKLAWAHTIFGNLKGWIHGTFHGISSKYTQLYLDEFTYRFDRRWREDELFGFVLRRATRSQPLPLHRLTAEPIG
jgi:transposase-like protein